MESTVSSVVGIVALAFNVNEDRNAVRYAIPQALARSIDKTAMYV